MKRFVENAGYIAFGQALIATLWSLYLSEILEWTPCLLCWYQRILMYPLVVIIGTSVIRRDGSWPVPTMILAGIGWLMALYHSLLQWGILSEALAPCKEGVSCVVRHGDSFITVPFLSLTAFTVILTMAFITWKGAKKNEQRV